MFLTMKKLYKKTGRAVLDSIPCKDKLKQVENYLQQHNIQATKTDMGTLWKSKIQVTGALIDSGKQVSVIYTGKLFPSGKVFETNDKEDGQAD